MSKKQENGCIGAAVVLAAVFMLGRCSVSEPATPARPTAAANVENPRRSLVVPDEPAAADANLVPIEDPFVEKVEPEGGAAAEPVEQEVYYRNCDAARAAGAAPVLIGEPGYAPRLDRDGDGVGCER